MGFNNIEGLAVMDFVDCENKNTDYQNAIIEYAMCMNYLKKEYPEMDEDDATFCSTIWMHISKMALHITNLLKTLSDDRKKNILISVFGIDEETIKENSIEECISCYYANKLNNLATVLKNYK